MTKRCGKRVVIKDRQVWTFAAFLAIARSDCATLPNGISVNATAVGRTGDMRVATIQVPFKGC